VIEYRITHRDSGDTITDVSIVEQEVRTLVDQDTGEEVTHRGKKTRRAFAPNDFLPKGTTVGTASKAQMQEAEGAMAKAAKEWVESRAGALLVDIDTLATVKAFKDVAEAERAAKEAAIVERDAAKEFSEQRAKQVRKLEAERGAKVDRAKPQGDKDGRQS